MVKAHSPQKVSGSWNWKEEHVQWWGYGNVCIQQPHFVGVYEHKFVGILWHKIESILSLKILNHYILGWFWHTHEIRFLQK